MFLATVTSRAAVMALGIPDTIREHASPALYFQVGMIGALFAATLVTGNAALRMLTVPTVQMLKVCVNCYHCSCCQLSELKCLYAWITAWLAAPPSIYSSSSSTRMLVRARFTSHTWPLVVTSVSISL
jgi:hypothetical protein